MRRLVALGLALLVNYASAEPLKVGDKTIKPPYKLPIEFKFENYNSFPSKEPTTSVTYYEWGEAPVPSRHSSTPTSYVIEVNFGPKSLEKKVKLKKIDFPVKISSKNQVSFLENQKQ